MSLKNVMFLFLVLNYVYGKKERIIGGFHARRNHFPYQVVLKRIADDTIIGGGAIISHYHILTAAHVVDERSISHTNLKICLGGSNHSHQFTSEYLPSQIFMHPEFERSISNIILHNNDIAVIKINGVISYNNFQTFIRLPTTNIFCDESAKISGWGTITYPNITFPKKLQAAKVIVIRNLDCQRRFPITVNAKQICVYLAPGIGPCTGDGGSPLIKADKVIGIYSLSHLCAQGVPDIYTNVYEYKAFILSVMQR